IIEESGFHIDTRYIPSAGNPVDGPSRGKLGPRNLLLPKTEIPLKLRNFIVDFDKPLTEAKQLFSDSGGRIIHATKPAQQKHQKEELRRQMEREAVKLTEIAKSWE
ncbi:hypothetical protein PQX77_007905, partial [Marasmius sp. AFHP31]